MKRMWHLSCADVTFPTDPDGRPGAPQAGRAGLPDPRRAVYRRGGLQGPVRVLLLWEPRRAGSLRAAALHAGEPLPAAAGQHRLRRQHLGRLLGEQLQARYRDQVLVFLVFFFFFKSVFLQVIKKKAFKVITLICHTLIWDWVTKWWPFSQTKR